MNPPSSPSSPQPFSAAVQKAATDWLARRDRGLSALEQDEYLQWLGADPHHAAAIAQHARVLERMMQLYEWTPANAVEPNPDLFAPPRRLERVRNLARQRSWWTWGGGLGFAAAAAVAVLLWRGAPATDASPAAALTASRPATFLHVNERLALPDGSRVELNDGAELVVLYSEGERRVRLAAGEAHFTVWKDPARPFVVEADGVEVVAVGTAFNVQLNPEAIEVLVTEGRVRVQSEAEPAPAAASSPTPSAALFVSIGHRAVVPRTLALGAGVRAGPSVTAVSTDEIAAELAWQAPRLQFDNTRLADAIAEFNRLNRHQLELSDPRLGELRIGGNFRPDNVDGFVRLLGLTFDIAAEPVASGRTVLSRAP